MSKPTNALIKAVQKNDPGRFRTRVRGGTKRKADRISRCCTCNEKVGDCVCDDPDFYFEEIDE